METYFSEFKIRLTWNVQEPAKLKTYSIYYSTNESIYLNEYIRNKF